MAAGTKTFSTQFLIGAKWVGGAGVAAAQRGLAGLHKAAQRAHRQMGSMASSVFAGTTAANLFNKAVSGTVQVLEKSFAAASEAQTAHDELGLSVERMAKRYKNLMGKSVAEVTASVEESTKALIAASEAMEQTGHDAETLQKGWAKLAATGAMDPKQILEARDAFSDILTYTAGVNANAEDSAQLGEIWADAILRGNIALLKRMDLETSEIALFQEATKQEKKGTITAEEAIKRRQDLLLRFARKFEGETVRAFGRPSGKIAQMWTQVSNLFEELGQPFVDRAPEMSEAFKQLAIDAKPAAEEMAKLTAEGLKGISAWFKEHKEEIPVWLDDLTKRLKGVYDLLMLFNKIPVIFDLPAFLRRWNVPWPQGKLPGTPTDINPALQQGEAGRRYREGINKAKIGTQGGTGPYYSLEVKRAEAVQKAEEKAAAKVITQGGTGPFYSDIQEAATKAATTATTAAATQATAASVGAPTPAQIKQVLAEAENRSIPATIRNRNPGGMYPGQAAQKFGTIGTQTLHAWGKQFKIAQFPTAVHGAAANMENLRLKYGGMTIRDAMVKWSGGYRAFAGPAGKFDPNTVISPEMLNDPGFMIPFMKAIASGETGGGEKALSEAQWKQAYDWYQKGGPQYGKAKTAAAPSETIRKAEPVMSQGTRMLKEATDPQHPLGKNPWGIQFSGPNAPAPPPPPKPLVFPKVSMEDAMMKLPGGPGSSLNRQIKEMNLQQRVSGATGGTNVAMNPTINVNGVAPGRESLMAKKTALALRDPTTQLIAEIKKARAEDNRTNYV